MASLMTVYFVLVSMGLVPQGYYGQVILFSALFGFGGAFISLLISKWMAKRLMGVQIVDTRGQFAPLVNKVHTLAKQAGLPKMPEVGVYESQEVNAFATGPSKSNSMVAVSTGLLNRMDSDEVHGVLAHEISHIANGDMVTMTLVQGVVNTLTLIVTYVVTNIIASALRGNSNRGIGDSFFVRMIIHHAIYAMVSFAAFPIVAAFSRWREYRADAGGAKLAGQATMISALEKLRGTVDSVETQEAAFQSMKISNKSGFAEWFSTHPPLDKRIKALQNR